MADVQTTIRMPEALRDALQREARESRISGNTIMIQAIKRELDARASARAFVDEIEAQNAAIRRRERDR